MVQKGRILIVDDHGEWRRLLSEILTQAGYSAVESDSGEDALELLSAAAPDLVLLDLCMAGMSGLDTAKQIRQIPRFASLPIILVSSDDVYADGDGSLPPHIDGHFQKYETHQKLLSCVSRLLDLRPGDAGGD